MNRRTALTQLGFFTGGFLITSCGWDEKDYVTENEMFLSKASQRALDRIVNTIIPRTDTLGAIDLQLEVFVINMINDCHGIDDKRKFLSGLVSLDEYARERYKKAPDKLSDSQAEELLSEIDMMGLPTIVPASMGFTFQMIKKYTIQGYLQSEYVMTEILPYTMIPGKFNGCIEISDKNIQTVIG